MDVAMEPNTLDQEPSPLPPQLPVMAIVKKAFVLPWRHKKKLTLVTLPPLSIFLLLVFLLSYMISSSDNIPSAAFWLYSILFYLIAMPPFAYTAVRYHRLFILEDSNEALQSLSWWSKNEWRFLGWTFAISFIGFIVTFIVGLVALTLYSAVVPDNTTLVTSGVASAQASQASLLYIIPTELVTLAITVQLFLVLPAAAMGKQKDINWSWTLAEGNRLRMFSLLGVIPLSISLLTEPYLMIPTHSWEMLIVKIILLVTALYLAAFQLALLSLCYRELEQYDFE
jgi:hypothetical protein